MQSDAFGVGRRSRPSHKERWIITVLRYNRLVPDELLGAGGALDPSLSGNGARNRSVGAAAEGGENARGF